MRKLLFCLVCALAFGQDSNTPKPLDALTAAQAKFYLTVKAYVEVYAPTPNVTCSELADAAISASSRALDEYEKALAAKFSLSWEKSDDIKNEVEKSGRRYAIQMAVEARFRLNNPKVTKP